MALTERNTGSQLPERWLSFTGLLALSGQNIHLERWKVQHTPKTPEDVLDDRFVEACQMLDYVEYLADLLIAAELEQRVKIVEMLNKNGLIAGLEERLTRLEKEEVTHEEKQAA